MSQRRSKKSYRNKNTRHNKFRHNHKRNQSHPIVRKTRRLLKKYKLYSLFRIWILQLVVIAVAFYLIYGRQINTLNQATVILIMISILISVGTGFWLAFKGIRKFDRNLGNDDFSIWLRRIAAVFMTFIGGATVFICIPIFVFIALSFTQMQVTSNMKLSYSILDFVFSEFVGIILGIGMCLMLLSLYMEFTFERKSGLIIFGGRQRF